MIVNESSKTSTQEQQDELRVGGCEDTRGTNCESASSHAAKPGADEDALRNGGAEDTRSGG